MRSNTHMATFRTSHFASISRQNGPDSNASIVVSDNQLPTGEKVFDHRIFLEKNPKARLVSVTVYGFNYITAIQTKFIVPGEEEPIITLHCGSQHEQAKRNEMHQETLNLESNEHIETVTCTIEIAPGYNRIRSLIFGTTFEKCLIMEGEVELGQKVDINDSLADFSKIDNDSILPESEANLDERRSDDLKDISKVEEDDNNKIRNHNEVEKRIIHTPKKDKRLSNKRQKGINSNSFKYQELDLSVYGRHLIGFRTIFNEYLEDLEVYTIKTPDVQDLVIR